jgi:hypothetical protein
MRSGKIVELIEVKTPFHLVRDAESKYIINTEESFQVSKRDPDRNEQPNPSKKKSAADSNTMTFNAFKHNGKAKLHNKKILNSQRHKLYDNHYKPPSDLGEVHTSMTHRLAQLNQKLWEKRTENRPTQPKNNRSSSHFEVWEPRARIESTKTLMSYYD